MNEKLLTVGALTREIKRLLGESFGALWIEGEISGFKLHSSGHAYFMLKDAAAQLSCVMWKGNVSRSSVALRDGMKLHAFGNIEVYEPQGKYQLIVSAVKIAGEGELQQQFEQLKARLLAEGLFDLGRKRRLPTYPQRIGIVTSPTGAVIEDMKTVAARRWPLAELVLIPVKVQGTGAGQEIASAIEQFNRLPGIDLMVVGRGGGSLEDLWAFNEEVVARAIFNSRLPVVSAVGHEVDYTIADMVADLRAPTPSAAMEIILPDREQVIELVEQLGQRLRRTLSVKQRNLIEQVNTLAHHWAFRQPINLVMMAAQRVDEFHARMLTATSSGLTERKQRLARLQELLTAYHPQHILERGFSIVRDDQGHIVRHAKLLHKDSHISLTFAEGSAEASVTTISSP